MNMTEWNRLVAGLLEGTLTGREREALLAMCRESEEVLEATVSVVGMDRLLAPAMMDPTGELTVREIVLKLGAEEGGVTKETWRAIGRMGAVWRRNSARKFLAWAAAVVLLACGIAGWGISHSPVGVLSRVEGVDWLTEKGVTEDGTVTRGAKLAAMTGLVELRMTNGARVILEGPFDVEMSGRMSMRLNHGRMAANCPPSAKGFTVETREGSVMDLGTEFGVSASEDGETEVHVLAGMVKMNPEQGRKISLFEGEAAKVRGNKTRFGSADSSAFITKIPDGGEGGGYLHWDFDEGEGARAAGSGQYLAMGADSALTLEADVSDRYGFGKGTRPEWVEGVKGGALKFDGKGSFAESNYKGIEGALPRTVAMWLKLPKGDASAGQGILSWGSATEYGVWQISVDWSPERGTRGRLRVGTYAGRVVGTTDLCDGKWHHVAVVLGPGPKPGVAGNVLFYIDGRLEPISVRNSFHVDTNVGGPTGVVLGRHSVPVEGMRNFFSGMMDEVFIFDRALVHKEIVHLMNHHSAP